MTETNIAVSNLQSNSVGQPHPKVFVHLSPAEFPAKPIVARQEAPVPQRAQSLFAAETGVRNISLRMRGDKTRWKKEEWKYGIGTEMEWDKDGVMLAGIESHDMHLFLLTLTRVLAYCW